MNIVLQNACFPELVEWTEELAGFRRDIHAHPELGFETARTCAKIVEALKRWGIESVDAETVKGGVLVVIEGSRPGKTVALRGDIDALPMNDASENAWKSTVAGRCHACGHDGHATWLLGALRYLHVHNDFPGRVLGIFQPAEESGGGALSVCDSGVFERLGVKELYGAHDEATLPKGVVGFCYGPAQASVDFFYITMKGVGTHGARPHLGVDPVPAAAELVHTLQTIVSRKVDPIEKAVVSVCSINAGSYRAANVIPAEATLSGTIRTFNEDVRRQIAQEMERMTAAVASANGCTAELTVQRMTPSVYNHPETTQAMADFVKRTFGPEYAKEDWPLSMGGEDFAEYQLRIPGSIVRIGIRDENHRVSIHNPTFDFNDELIAAGSTLLAGVARERLEALAREE